jgi:CRISPR-associated protein Cmr6
MDINEIPHLYRAQVNGRCQLQRILRKDELEEKSLEQNEVYDWAESWLKIARQSDVPPCFGKEVETSQEIKTGQEVLTKKYTITWRLVTNGGQDEAIIHPIFGKKGYPFFPGSSMKGAFRRAFQKLFPHDIERLLRYCGGMDSDDKLKPGILRFHGAYPVDEKWKNPNEMSLVDIVHPQQEPQVQNEEKSGAFFLISLLRPTLKFGISSCEKLSEKEWNEVLALSG